MLPRLWELPLYGCLFSQTREQHVSMDHIYIHTNSHRNRCGISHLTSGSVSRANRVLNRWVLYPLAKLCCIRTQAYHKYASEPRTFPHFPTVIVSFVCHTYPNPATRFYVPFCPINDKRYTRPSRFSVILPTVGTITLRRRRGHSGNIHKMSERTHGQREAWLWLNEFAPPTLSRCCNSPHFIARFK